MSDNTLDRCRALPSADTAMPTDTPKRRLPAAARRALIVDAALDEFAVNGYEGASMGRIGTAAGVSRTVLYDHFRSKRALFAALVANTHAALLSHLQAAMTADVPMEERMRRGLDSFFAFAEHQPQAWKLLFPDRAPVDSEVATDYHRLRAESNRLMAAMLAPDARRAGIDPASTVGQAMFALQQSALHGAVRWWHAHPDVEREQLVIAAMDLLWTGISGLERGECWVRDGARDGARAVG
jgi:AcrR family transcriptional regulator